MASPDVRTKKRKTLRFRKGNKIAYAQDFRFYRGIPHGVDFEATRLTPSFIMLVAPGYGCLDGRGYGNGALFVWGRHVNQRFQKKKRSKKAS